MYNAGNPLLVGCTFTNNSAGINGGGMANGFGAEPRMVRCTYLGNTAAHDGGGMYNAVGVFSTMTNCVFADNAASHDGGGLCNLGDQTAGNCLFSANIASGNGGGVFTGDFGTATLVNCTLGGNSAKGLGGGFYHLGTDDSSLTNCIFWGNLDGAYDSGDSQPPIQIQGNHKLSVRYSLVQGGWTGQGKSNSDADPMFANAAMGDYSLRPGSPAIDAGSNGAVLPDDTDLNTNGDTEEPTPFDLAGRPRFLDDAGTADHGSGTAPIVDVGAFEFQHTTGDFDGDGDVDLNDFTHFGSCLSGPGMSPDSATPPVTGGDCLLFFDLDADGDVDIRDFAAFQQAFTQ